MVKLMVICFNTQPPEGGWDRDNDYNVAIAVSTHSRPKAAGRRHRFDFFGVCVSTHSRPKAAGSGFYPRRTINQVSTHSRPKAAGV